MQELTTEQVLRIDLHKARLSRSLIERGMLPSIADRTVNDVQYEYLASGALRIAHGQSSLSDSSADLDKLAQTLSPSANVSSPLTAEQALAQINAANAAKPNPLQAKRN